MQNQTLKDIEIIAVNDYSNDKSLKMLINFAKNDKRIKIINNDKNHGLLYSRAMGIFNSSGEYLMNLDPDDELKDCNDLKYLYNKAKISKADIIAFNIIQKKNNRIIKCKLKNRIIRQPKIFESIFNAKNILQDYLIWNKLIKKEIFIKASELLKKYIYNGKWNFHEDNIWSILVHKYAKTKLCVNKLIYIYNNNNDSLINNRYNLMEFQNIIYLLEMYKIIFSLKKDEKYLFAKYIKIINIIKSKMKYLLLLNDNNINEYFINFFYHFMNNYKCSIKQKKYIKKIINLIKKNNK